MARTALITGAAGDLGRAMAAALSADGWTLILCDHPAQHAKLAEVAAELAAPATHLFDVTDETSVREAFAAIVAEHCTPTAVVANAGVQGRFKAVADYDVTDLRRVLDVNVVGAFTVLAAAARAMIAAEAGGSIVLSASMAGVTGAPNMPAYSASKAAVIGLAKASAKDLAPHGIRVNAISPAFIGPGAMWDNQVREQAQAGSQYFATDPETVARQMIEMIPMRRYGSPEEVANVVRFLLSGQSTYLTGQNIEITGGSV